MESGNKVRPLEIEQCTENDATDSKRRIRCNQSAAEMACLCRYLGLMIGDKIDPDDEYWNVYRILRKVIGIVTAPSFVLADLHECKIQIEKLLSESNRLLRDIPPKGHNAVHIVEVMMLNGPLIHCWSMPFERKNRDQKLWALSTNSHKNVPYSIGVRNQLYMSLIREKCNHVESCVKLGTITQENAYNDMKKIVQFCRTF